MKGVRVVAGTNLPMLLECLLSVDESADADALADQAIEVGRAGISAPQLGSLAEASEGDAEEGGI
jgi:PTS system N-acetylgalactosamine-specific IIA component